MHCPSTTRPQCALSALREALRQARPPGTCAGCAETTQPTLAGTAPGNLRVLLTPAPMLRGPWIIPQVIPQAAGPARLWARWGPAGMFPATCRCASWRRPAARPRARP